ncbi:MAG TPA: NAD-binding protein [Gammaproteobacteria bacterium]|nr:NAD-binding protein [Gammaproteobacteria bacterium]
MQNVIYLMLRRMRLPLIVVILAYTISITGLVLIPGVDDQGNPWRMTLFHAFYFVSYMGTTIGFGEVPYPFTDSQRLWTSLAMYLTVISWLYAIGSLFAVLQDPAFKRVLAYTTFTRSVRKIKESFYLVCGLGDAGQLVVRELAADHIRVVVIDRNEDRVQSLHLENFPVDIPALCADVADSSSLLAAGLDKPECAGVIALTGNDHVNLTVAISSKLLAPEQQVICRSDTHDEQANMASFGTDYIINPFDAFAERFAMMFQSPSMFLVYEWMTSIQETPLREFVAPPRGTWVVCGFGRFGKAVQKSLSFKGIRTVIVELDIKTTAAPEGTIEGRGTEAITLYEAGIEHAEGVIAGTDDDANNLSIIMTARDMNKNLFTVARQNLSNNDGIFAAANIDLIMKSGTIIGRRILDLITNPLLTNFLRLARTQNEKWANILVSRVAGILTDQTPETWTLTISDQGAPALHEAFRKDQKVSLRHLTTDPREVAQRLPCVPLYLVRADQSELLLPEDDTLLHDGDRLLFCGRRHAEIHMLWTANNHHALNFICTGHDRPSGAIWRLLSGNGAD